MPLLAGAVPALMYVLGVMRIESAFGRPWSSRRTCSFVIGCASIAIALSPLVDHLAIDDPRAHMVQHLLLGMYAPIALALGAPITLLLGAMPVQGRTRVRTALGGRFLRTTTKLAVATSLNVGGLFLLYLTPLYAFSTRSDIVHHLVHLHLLAAGYLFAWAVAGPDPSRHRSRLPWRIVALIVASGAHSFLAKLVYSRAPRWPPGASLDTAEVQHAAQLMYYGGHVAEILLLIALFASWYRKARVGADWSRLRRPESGGHRSWVTRATEPEPPGWTPC